MKISEKLKDFFFQTLLLVTGGLLCAIAVKGILIPNDFMSSGFTGFALILYYLFPILPVGLIYFLINVPIFLIGWRFIGLRFILYTSWGIIIYSVLLFVVTIKIDLNDKLLASIIAGGLSGIGSGIMLRTKGSSGGSEILCAIFFKYFHITLGTGMLIINTVVMLVAMLFFPLENVLYTVVFVFVSAKAADMLFHGLSKRQAVLIVSDDWNEILDELVNDHKIGVTVIDGSGGYEGTDKKLLYSVITRDRVYLLKKLVLSKDPNAFISIIEASDVTGLNIGNQPKW